MANRNSNKLVVPQASRMMEKLKLEIAAELGIPDYDKIDKGALPSRVNGMVGGSITKKLVQLGQAALANQSLDTIPELDYQEYAQEAQQDLQQ